MKFDKILKASVALSAVLAFNASDLGGNEVYASQAAVATRVGQATVNLNFRTGAGTNHRIIRTLGRGTNVTILSESGGWMRVRVGNQEGFVSSRFVRVTGNNAPAPTPQPISAGTRTGQTTTGLNFRRGAGTNHGIIRTLGRGTNVTILSESGGWMRVRVGNQEGFVSSRFIRVTGAAAPAPAQTAPPVTGTRTGQTTTALNFRRGAGTNHRIIRTLGRGTNVTILSESGGWMRVRVGNQEGFVSSRFIRVTAQTPTPPPAPTPPPVTGTRTGQTTTALNFRRGAGTNHRIIRTLGRGTNVTILSESGGWMRVRVGNQEGFVSSRFIRVTTPPAPTPPAPTPPAPTPPPVTDVPVPAPGQVSDVATTINIGATGIRMIVPRSRTISVGQGFNFMEGVRAEHVSPEGVITNLPVVSNGYYWQFAHGANIYRIRIVGVADNLTPGRYDRTFQVIHNNTVVGEAPQAMFVQ